MSNGPSWCETILRLRAGEAAPAGYEIKRLIGHYQEPTGAGTNVVDVYVVACRGAAPSAVRSEAE